MYSYYLVFLFITLSWGFQRSYNGYKVFRIKLVNNDDFDKLMQLKDNSNVDIWTGNMLQKYADIMVSPNYLNEFSQFLISNDFQNEVLVDNIQSVLEKELVIQTAENKNLENKFSFYRYNSYFNLLSYLYFLSQNYPNITRIVEIGKSYLNKSLTMIQISTDPSANKPVIFIDGGIHAREWIAPAQAMYIINQLLEGPDHSFMLEKVDWYILPLVNPDGYEYSMKFDYFWRKTVSPNNKKCFGTDANRNFGEHWGETGSSADPCSDVYRGRKPFSEIETLSLRNFLLSNSNIKLYLSLHSYGRLILYPWGYTTDLPNDSEELYQLGNSVAEAIKIYDNETYNVMSSGEWYIASGDSVDWAKAKANIQLSYTIELPMGKESPFHPLPSEILPIVKELWPGIQVFHKYIVDKYT